MEVLTKLTEVFIQLLPLVGVLVGALAVAIFTKSREHSAWLRNHRLDALAKFLGVSFEFASFVSTAVDREQVDRFSEMSKQSELLMVIGPKPLSDAVHEYMSTIIENYSSDGSAGKGWDEKKKAALNKKRLIIREIGAAELVKKRSQKL
ncbi:hypothetical protein I6E74_00755 [Salinibacterium sp. SWN139]|uniref:hypothetical protein n=1 Tax=Salinibacterium sp. SWN139 TaxID=2792055 RepID=UPI0018CF0CA0|nr:hypothetical protein [Salinibacterium sp. SWN139]MBH0052696.1 hypothetical protein [Salinibacterium sp. SWN139]